MFYSIYSHLVSSSHSSAMFFDGSIVAPNHPKPIQLLGIYQQDRGIPWWKCKASVREPVLIIGMWAHPLSWSFLGQRLCFILKMYIITCLSWLNFCHHDHHMMINIFAGSFWIYVYHHMFNMLGNAGVEPIRNPLTQLPCCGWVVDTDMFCSPRRLQELQTLTTSQKIAMNFLMT